MNFYGYKRPDGRVGVRNKVLILPASVCASDTTRIISQQVVGSVTFNNQLGCSQVAPDQQFTMDVMAGYAANPNVYGTVVVSLGMKPLTDEALSFYGAGDHFYMVGDCYKPGTIQTTNRSAYVTAMKI